MKRLLLTVLLLAGALNARAQDPDALIQEILRVNMPATLQGKWHQVRHTQLLQDNLESDGLVYVQQPGCLRWETLSPIPSLLVFDGETPAGRFRLPSQKDFRITVLEGEQFTLNLVPVRRDLKQLFAQISLTVDRASLRVLSALMTTADGDWTLLEFQDIRSDVSLSPDLFQKP